MSKPSSIILCGGKINFVNLPIKSNTSNSMIPVNGKPVISWILEDLIAKGFNHAVVVHRADDLHLKQFLSRTFCTKMQLDLVELTDSPSILHSLKAGLEQSNLDHSIQVILGDTLIRDSFENLEDSVYTHPVEDSTRWCIAETNEYGYIKDYHEKRDNLNVPLEALCGYYKLSHSEEFYKLILKCIVDGKNQLSDALKSYGKKFPVKSLRAEYWYDFGNIENLLFAKRQLLQSRYFNSLYIHPVLNTITKESEFDDKLRNELKWYEELPSELSVLSPRIIKKAENKGRLVFTQEYYGYPTLSELFLYSDLGPEDWYGILRKMFEIINEFSRFKVEFSAEELRDIFIQKIFQRIELLTKDSQYWTEIMAYPHILIDGEKFEGWPSICNYIEVAGEELVQNPKIGIIHGDLCFSNILFDVNNQIVKLIDPRGSFGKVGIFGDMRYDLAKLRHSIHGLYDYVVSDLFEVSIDQNKISSKIFSNNTPDYLVNTFDSLLEKLGYKVNEIKFIEGCLFLSMLPLHKDNLKRQLMMFSIGIKLLNECKKGNSINSGIK